MAHARVYNDYIVERFTPYFARLAPTAPIPLTDVDEAVAEIERVGRRRVPGDPASGHAAQALLLPRLRPGLGGGPGQRRARLHPHPDGRGEGQRPRGHHAQGRHGDRRAQVNQPMTEKSASKRMITQCDLQHHRPAAGDLRAHRRRRPRALPRPPLRADRVQRPLAGVAGRRHGQVLGHRHRPGRRLVARRTGTTPVRANEQTSMAQLFRLNEKWPYPLKPSEYVKRQFHVSFQDDPVAVACRHITGLSDHRVGQRLPARRGDVPRQPSAHRRAVRRRARPTSATPWSAAPWAGCSGSRLRWPPERA